MDSNFENDDSDEKLAHYINIGAITLEGVDEHGEIIYAITEAAEALAPELWESHKNHIDDSLIKLYNEGLLAIEYNENLEVKFSLSPEGNVKAKEYGLIEFINQNIPNN